MDCLRKMLRSCTKCGAPNLRTGWWETWLAGFHPLRQELACLGSKSLPLEGYWPDDLLARSLHVLSNQHNASPHLYGINRQTTLGTLPTAVSFMHRLAGRCLDLPVSVKRAEYVLVEQVGQPLHSIFSLSLVCLSFIS